MEPGGDPNGHRRLPRVLGDLGSIRARGRISSIGANPIAVRDAIERSWGPNSGLEVLTAKAREARIDSSASEGLGQTREISTLLLLAAILAMAAALGSSIWQRRTVAGRTATRRRPPPQTAARPAHRISR